MGPAITDIYRVLRTEIRNTESSRNIRLKFSIQTKDGADTIS